MLKEKVAYDKFKDKSYITHNASEGKFRISLIRNIQLYE